MLMEFFFHFLLVGVFTVRIMFWRLHCVWLYWLFLEVKCCSVDLVVWGHRACLSYTYSGFKTNQARNEYFLLPSVPQIK